MLILVLPRQLQIGVRCLLRLFDESMEQNHSASFVDIKKHPRNSILSQACPYLIDALAQGPANRHANRPAELYGFDVLSDSLPVIR